MLNHLITVTMIFNCLYSFISSTRNRISVFWILISVLTPVQVFPEASSRLVVRVVDEHGKNTPARAWLEVEGRRIFQPVSPDTVTVYEKDRSFSFNDGFTMELPTGNAIVHIEKGKEYVPVDRSVLLEAGPAIEQTIQLKRWVDMPAEGWYSADMHVHLGQDNPRILEQLALADDVHLMPVFTYWLRGRGETWEAEWPDESYPTPLEIDDRHVMTRNNIEIERIGRNAVPGGAIGATFLYNLQRPVSAVENGEYFPTDAFLCRAAQAHSPEVVLDSDKPSWAETVIGAALGALDTIQVCHNHYHRTQTLPGGWGMIGPLTVGESNMATGDDLFYRTNNLYYRLLNCGFRLAVSGGSAIGVMEVPTGYNRVYAQVDGRFTAAKFWEATKSGRSFATSGPMLTLQADGHGVGAALSRSSENISPINLTTRVRSIDGLESLQIVHNGIVVGSLNLAGKEPTPVLDETLRHALILRRSGWVAARALFRAPDGLLRQAHTSPIYITVDGKPIVFAEEALYMLRWVAVLDSIARENPGRFPSKSVQESVLADYEEARAVYAQILVDARRHWAD